MILKINSVFFVEFIFEDNVLNEIFENKFPLKITRYTVVKALLQVCTEKTTQGRHFKR